jgi:ADP-L-glycero-D-manno-heptose 6-epimerase
MASVAYHFFSQYRATGSVKLFEGSGGYGDGEQRRDFVFIDDVVRVNLYFLEQRERSGIFNVGTGAAQSFNDVALATVNACRRDEGKPALALSEAQAQGAIRYIAFPPDLEGKYQHYTQADLSALRGAGYAAPFMRVEEGVQRYCERLLRNDT